MNNAKSRGASEMFLLGVVFVILKLTGVIDWSWWWVFAPFIYDVVTEILCDILYIIDKLYQRNTVRD